MENQSQSIIDFVDRLVKEKNFENISPSVRAQIKADLLDRVEDRINMTILENMPPEKLEQFSALLDTASPEEIQRFCVDNIADLDEVIAQELVDFRGAYLNS